MKERSLPNQYLLLETLKRRFQAVEVKTGMERARELAAQAAELAEPAPFDHIWFWKTKLPERKGQRCRIVSRGAMNSILVEFEDGKRVLTSRHAARLTEGADSVTQAPRAGRPLEPASPSVSPVQPGLWEAA